MKNKEKYLEEFVRKSLIEEDGGIHFMKEHGIADYFNDDKPMINCIAKLLAWFEEEYHEPILDEKEKEYLSAVIRPWRDIVSHIFKCEYGTGEKIVIVTKRVEVSIHFPYFKKGTMYKGMELDRKYTLEELNI